MSTAEVVNLPSGLARTAPSQTTQIEQSRAIAEVQAAIYVAQQFPRDMRRVWDEVRDACSRLALANKAFYAVKNRGNGPSVHLARAIIRIYGNADYGVRELSRDDTAGRSEIQAFAWDQQSNVRSTRTFQVPHQRMKNVNGKATRESLIDLTDVYLNNQNVGARAVRECVASVLPSDLWEEAQRLCRETLDKGDGKPLVDRINDMIAAFGSIGVGVAQMEARLDRKRREWTGADIGQMTIAYQSIQHGDAAKDELFPPATRTVTAAEIIGKQPPAPAPPANDGDPGDLLSDGQLKRMQILFKEKKFKDSLDRHSFIEQTLELETDTIASSGDITHRQAELVIAALEALDA